MDLQSQLRVVARQWWLVLASVMVALGVAALVTVRTPPRYAASVTFFVTTSSPRVTEAYQGNLFLQQRVKSYADLLRSDRLAAGIAAADPVGLTGPQIQDRISAQAQLDTVLLTATVVDREQARALRLAQALASQFGKLVQTIETPPGAKDPVVKVEVVGGPRTDPDPVAPRPARNLTLGGLLGLLLGVGAAMLRGLADRTVRDGAVLAEAVDAPLLGEVPFDKAMPAAPLIVGLAAGSPRAEAMRKLRTNLRFVDLQEPARVVAVTSALQGEGKSTTSCNLAIALAEAGWQVLLVDADLRRPQVAEYLGLDGRIGLTDVLLGEAEVADVLQAWGERSLLVLPAGQRPPNPSELLGSKNMADLLLSFRESADIVIVDTAPLLPVTDGVVVAVQADGALLVTRSGSTSLADAGRAADALRAVDARVLGCVLNMAKVHRAEAYRYRSYGPTLAPAAGPANRGGTQSRHAAPVTAVEQTLPVQGPAPAAPTVLGTVSEPTQELSRVPR
jgi:capsular exopolysaccharide synthesis family protein